MSTKTPEQYEIASFNRRLLVRLRDEAQADALATSIRFCLDINVCATLAKTPAEDLFAHLPNQYHFLARLVLPESFWLSRKIQSIPSKNQNGENRGSWFALNQELLLKGKNLAMASISHCCFALDLTMAQATMLMGTSIDSINALARDEAPIFAVNLDATLLDTSLNMPPEFADLYAVMYSPDCWQQAAHSGHNHN